MLEEYFAVLNIPKLTTNPDFVLNAALFRKEIDKTAVRFQPKIKLNLITAVGDYLILEIADEGAALFMTIGDYNEFTFLNDKYSTIKTPKYF